MERYTRLGMYRILRKLGIQRNDIYPEATFSNDFFFDENDWQCFLFFVESNFDISLNDDEIMNLTNIESSINVVNSHLCKN